VEQFSLILRAFEVLAPRSSPAKARLTVQGRHPGGQSDRGHRERHGTPPVIISSRFQARLVGCFLIMANSLGGAVDPFRPGCRSRKVDHSGQGQGDQTQQVRSVGKAGARSSIDRARWWTL